MVKVGINGFGRIGRCALRIAVKNPEVEVVAVNARSGIDTYAHLLKYDTLHGTFDEDVRVDGDVMIVGDRRIKFTRFTEPKEIPWGEPAAGFDPPGWIFHPQGANYSELADLAGSSQR